MKKVLFGSIGALVLATIPMSSTAAEIAPVDLVFQGYQGRLASEGIPGYGAFRQAVYLGKVDAETLVKGAVAKGRLSSSTANNKGYLRRVEASLFQLRSGGGRR